MIEARRPGEHQCFEVRDGDTLLCTVATIYRSYGGLSKTRYHGPDWPATKARYTPAQVNALFAESRGDR